MEMKHGIELLVGIAVLLIVRPTVGSTLCSYYQATSVDDCVTRSQVWLLPQDDPAVYCVEGPRRMKQVYDCLAACQFSPGGNRNFATAISSLDNYCAGRNSRCGSIAERYNNFTSCFKDGMASVLSGIILSSNQGNTTALSIYCQNLAWGRNCQLQIAGDCPYLTTLQSTDTSSNFLMTSAFYVCGAESGHFTYSDNSFCSPSMLTAVNEQCDITCDISNAKNQIDICQTMQAQVDCIFTNTAGCSVTQSNYLVPRLASYWGANELLGCTVQVSGFIVKPRAAQCKIDSLLSACFNLSASGFRSLDAVKQLLTMQFPLTQICSLLKNSNTGSSVLVRNCLASMTSCILPLAQVYNWPTIDAPPATYATTPYIPRLGPFAVNAWGLNTLISNLEPITCQATGHVMCVTTQTITKSTPSVPAEADRMTPRQTKRATPATPRATPKSPNDV